MRRCTGDIEADGFLYDATTVWCGVFIDEDTNEVFRFYPGSHVNYITAMLEFLDTVGELRMHNGIGYDLPLLRRLYGYEYTGKVLDTLLMSRVQRPKRIKPINAGYTGPHSVESWGVRLGLAKVEHEEWDRYSPEMLERCETDVRIQQKIYNAVKNEGKNEGWEKAHDLTGKLFFWLQKQEENGWLVDQDHLNHSLVTLDRWIDRIDRAITNRLPLLCEVKETRKEGEYNFVRKPFKKDGSYAAITEKFLDAFGDGLRPDVAGPFCRVAFRRVDLDKNAEVKEFLLNLGWVPAEWNTNDAGEQTSPKLSKDDPFDGVQNGLGKLIAKRVQCKQRRGVLEGWKKAIRPDGRLPSVVTGLAVTYRATHAGIVNVPRPGTFFGAWMRKCFVARPSWVQVGVDSDACQIRMLAARMGDPDYIDTILNGRAEDGTDMHTIHQHAAGIETRNKAKTFFYGLIFGSGDAKTAYNAGLWPTPTGGGAKGKQLKEFFFRRLPALGDCVAKLTAEWRQNAKKYWNKKWGRFEYRDGWITGLDGRRIFIDSEHKILVGALQSDEAIMMAMAYVKWHEWVTKIGYVYGVDFATNIWMHDEWQFECRPELADELGRMACEAIEWAGKYYRIPCPHKGNYDVGKNWCETH